jgi:hypothetical protein
MAVLLEPILNQILQAEMTEHLKAKPGEQTDDRRGYRNGGYERQLTTRVGTIELEVPRDRDGTIQTALFQRYQRSEKARVLTLMQMVVQGVSTRRVKEVTTQLDDLRETLAEKAPSALKMASTTRLPCLLCPRSTASGSTRPPCWNTSPESLRDRRRKKVIRIFPNVESS